MCAREYGAFRDTFDLDALMKYVPNKEYQKPYIKMLWGTASMGFTYAFIEDQAERLVGGDIDILI